MPQLVRVIQFVFCFVSMVLTSLFALSLSGITIEELDNGLGSTKKLLSAGLFVLIGACIDLGKYLFWAQRDKSVGYLSVSLILTGFSLLASCAFFISAEISAINNSRLMSSEYQAHQQRITALNLEINYQESLLRKRLASEYHSQWAEGEKNSDNLKTLRDSLADLVQMSSEIGYDVATNKTPVTGFFLAISSAIKVEVNSVRTVFFGLLALLLEVNTLGAISLSRSLRLGNNEKEVDPSLPTTESLDEDFKHREKVMKLSSDILNGDTQPVVRRIRAAQYGLDLHEIKTVLANLYQTGLIDKDARKSYKLIKEKSNSA